MTLPEQLLDTWRINNRINLYLLEAIPPEGLVAVLTGMKGRSVGAIFAHLHNACLMWLEVAGRDLMDGLSKIPARSKADKAAITKDLLRGALEASGAPLATLLERGFASGRITGAKPHPAAFLGYLMAHDAYHRAEMCMTLTEAGLKLPDEVLYGMWEWGKR